MDSKKIFIISLAVVAAGGLTLYLQDNFDTGPSEASAGENYCEFNSCWGTDETDQCEGGELVKDKCGECYIPEPIYEGTIQCLSEYDNPTCFTGTCNCVKIPDCEPSK